MATLDKLCGLGRDVEAGGKTYHISPVSLATLGRMQLWAEQRPLAQARAELAEFGELYDDERKGKLIDAAREEMLRIRRVRERREPDEAEVDAVAKYIAAAIDGVEGRTQLLWLCLLPHQPDATLADAEAIIDTIGIDVAGDIIDEINETPKHPLDEIMGAEKKTDQGGWSRTGRKFFARWLVRMAGHLLRLAAWVSLR